MVVDELIQNPSAVATSAAEVESKNEEDETLVLGRLAMLRISQLSNPSASAVSIQTDSCSADGRKQLLEMHFSKQQMEKFTTHGSDYIGAQFMGVKERIAALIDSGASNTLISKTMFGRLMAGRKANKLAAPA
jgi:hypothetical protein